MVFPKISTSIFRLAHGSAMDVISSPPETMMVWMLAYMRRERERERKKKKRSGRSRQ